MNLKKIISITIIISFAWHCILPIGVHAGEFFPVVNEGQIMSEGFWGGQKDIEIGKKNEIEKRLDNVIYDFIGNNSSGQIFIPLDLFERFSIQTDSSADDTGNSSGSVHPEALSLDVASFIAYYGLGFDEAIAMLDDPDATVREREVAITILGETGTAQAVDILIAHIMDEPDEGNRDLILETLEGMTEASEQDI
ncbi:MAG: HEAT repeat domain-containing protein, partial [Candidatus Omnitrophota bacterium]